MIPYMKYEMRLNKKRMTAFSTVARCKSLSTIQLAVLQGLLSDQRPKFFLNDRKN